MTQIVLIAIAAWIFFYGLGSEFLEHKRKKRIEKNYRDYKNSLKKDA